MHWASNSSYFSFKQAINSFCQKNALIFVASSPLTRDSLANLNELHQSYSAWISYTATEGEFQVHSFYRRIFDLVELNDFDGQKQLSFSQESQEVWVAFLELCQRHKKSVDLKQVMTGSEKEAALRFPAKLCIGSERKPYQPLWNIFQ